MPGPNYDAGGEIDLFDSDSLIELNKLLASEVNARKEALKETDIMTRRYILEQSDLRKKALQEAYELEVANIKRAVNDRLEIERNVNAQLISIGAIKSQKELEDRKNKRKKELEEEKADRIKAAEDWAAATGGDAESIKKNIEAEYNLKEKKEMSLLDKKYKKEQKLADKLRTAEAYAKSKERAKELEEGIFGSGKTLAQRATALKSSFTNEDGSFNLKAGFINMTNALSDLAKKLENQIDTVGSKKALVDTRMQGSGHKTGSWLSPYSNSYWENINDKINGVAGVSPFITQEAVVSNLEMLVKKGIAYNVEQRAFLQTMSDKIANTFNAADGTLLRLIRIQQQDSTAGRLGMESALNAFLNNMYETSEYLTDLAEGIRSSLEEAQALTGAAEAAELEWQVQKWLGSLYSVGVSNKGVSGIADALGKIIAGDISGITSGGSGNLVIMAANQAGLSIADILAEGLDSSGTNLLLRAMVDYLGKIYDSATDSRVVQQQIASVYGLTASDLKALKNLSTTDRLSISSKN